MGERLSVVDLSTGAVSGVGKDVVTYALQCTPCTSSLADRSKLAALENTVNALEKKLGNVDPACHFSDLNVATEQLQRRLALMEGTIDIKRIHQVKLEVDELLKRKPDLQGISADNTEQKVCELYEFCHKWISVAALLPSVVSRLQSLQALHRKHVSFSERLSKLEQQQEELVRLLESTSGAVQDLGVGMRENMAAIQGTIATLDLKLGKT